MSNFMITSQDKIIVQKGESIIETGAMFSQINYNLDFFNFSIQINNNELINESSVAVQQQISQEICNILKKAKEVGWVIFDEAITKLEKPTTTI